MKTSLFDFSLPESLIATHPADPRDSARMLVVDPSHGTEDHLVSELPAFLRPGDVMVFNDTRVIPARLWGKRGAAGVEVLLHKRLTSPPPPEGGGREVGCRGGKPELAATPHPNPPPQGGRELLWRCFARPAKKLRPGDRIDFADDFHATVVEKLESGEVVLDFSPSPSWGEGGVGASLKGLPGNPPPQPSPQLREGDFYAKLQRYGAMPLPPYIRRAAGSADAADYQTRYAKHDGSVAAPTAGLHFTDALLKAIDAAGIIRLHVTLHVGGGTFLPVKVDDTDDHVMHSETAELSAETAAALNAAKGRGARVVAVGTTSLRTLESATGEDGIVRAFSGDTAIFITPGYRFRLVDVLLTNFHLPRSTLFMLVSAFSGLERMQAAYRHAIAKQYRFYSYGDACLLFRASTSSDRPNGSAI